MKARGTAGEGAESLGCARQHTDRTLTPAAPHTDYQGCRLATRFLAGAVFFPQWPLMRGFTLAQKGVAQQFSFLAAPET